MTLNTVSESMHLNKLKSICAILFILLFYSCSDEKKFYKTNCFYYWKSTFDIDIAESNRLEQLNVQKLYTKYFDIIWDNKSNEPEAISILNINKNLAEESEIVPVVYITNETFIEMNINQIPQLATNINNKIKKIHNRMDKNSIPEIQIDCDWTLKTRDIYFYFLKKFNDCLDIHTILSATIRLHQVKYSERTGIPPVDRGSLMFYNMSNLKEYQTKNSILNFEVGKKYLNKMSSYPLPLDIVLPVYSWGILYQGDNFIGIINNITKNMVIQNSGFTHLHDNYYKAEREIYLNNVYIFKNDIIRIDESDYQELKKSAQFLSKNLNTKTINVILFSFESNRAKEWSPNEIETIYNCFN